MPRELEDAEGLYGRGSKFTVRAGDLEQATLGQNETTIWAEQVPQDKHAWFGHGPEVRDYAKAFIYATLVASGNGSLNAGDPIEGELVAAITDSEQRRVLASVTIDDLGELADAETSDRTQRPVMNALGPYAKPGRHLEFRILPASGSVGAEVDPSASSARLYYSKA
jgi:hypothetical protein